jgi:hypothetical protein
MSPLVKLYRTIPADPPLPRSALEQQLVELRQEARRLSGRTSGSAKRAEVLDAIRALEAKLAAPVVEFEPIDAPPEPIAKPAKRKRGARKGQAAKPRAKKSE